MAGLFGGPKAGAAGKRKFDWGDAALGFFGVPVGQLAARRQKEREAEAAAAQQKKVEGMIDGDPNLSPLDREYAKANPEAYIKIRMERFRPMDTGPGGGSRGLPGPDGTIASWQTAPRFDDSGNIYGPGTGTSMPPILQRGTKTIPLQPGGTVQVLDSISGRPVSSSGGAPVLTDEDIRRMDQGGAGPQAPRIFPF